MVKTGKRFKKRSIKSTYALTGEQEDVIVFRGNDAPRKGDKKRRKLGVARDQVGMELPPPQMPQLERLTRKEREIARLMRQPPSKAARPPPDAPAIAKLRELARVNPARTTPAAFSRAVAAAVRTQPAPRPATAKRVAKRQAKSAARLERKREREDDEREERRFRGEPEHIRFGEVAQAPPQGIEEWTAKLEHMRRKMQARGRDPTRPDESE